MENSRSLLIDVLKILPEHVVCYVQAPSLEDDVFLKMTSKTEYDYYSLIHLDKTNKEILIRQILSHSIDKYFQNIQLKLNDKLLFEGYDGIEFGIISNSINIPEWFINEYIIKEGCIISKDW